MDEERQQVTGHILDIDKRLHLYLQRSWIPQWAEVDLTMPQLKLLFLVGGGGGPMPNSHVARALGMTLSTTTGVVDRLVAQGLIQRLEHPADRRLVLLQATPEGSALLERLLRAGLGYFRQILDRLTTEELRTVSRAFDLLHQTAMALASDQQSAAGYQPSAIGIQHPAASRRPSAISHPKGTR
ncbi:MAG: MarR family winged helix-turn-helix transcriptional regulator [Chloroflexota bacterium]